MRPQPIFRITEKEWSEYRKQAGNQLFEAFTSLTQADMSMSETIRCLQACLDIFRRMEAAGICEADKSNWLAIHDDMRATIVFYRREDYDLSKNGYARLWQDACDSGEGSLV